MRRDEENKKKRGEEMKRRTAAEDEAKKKKEEYRKRVQSSISAERKYTENKELMKMDKKLSKEISGAFQQMENIFRFNMAATES